MMTNVPMPSRSSRLPVLLLVIALVLCALAYLGGMSGGFLFDDMQTLVANPALRAIGTTSQSWFAIALSSGAGMLRRPISMFSFGLNVAAFGMNPVAFKLVNLAIHLANGALVYAIGRRLASRLLPTYIPGDTISPDRVALFVAAIWLMHPLHVSSVLYVVQRMNELAALFTLLGLLCYVDGRIRMLRGESALGQAILGLCLFGVLAVFSKENGALIVAYALVIETFCFGFEATQVRERRAIKGFFWITIGVPLAIAVLYTAVHPHWSDGGYAGRDFTMYQRLLSEARIVCDYLLWIFVPNPAWMGIYHDDIATSTGVLQPATTLAALVFLALAVLAAWKWRRASPGLAFGVAWFLAGHLMESTVLPLELVFEHRNYLPMAGLLLGVACAVTPWLRARISQRAIALLGCAAVLILGALTAQRALVWGDPVRLALTDVRNHPDSARCQYEAARAIVSAGIARGERAKAEQEAMPHLMRAAELDRNEIYPLSGLVLMQARTQAVPAPLLADLADRLRRARSYVQVNPFMDMLVSASEEPLLLTAADIDLLVEAALSNARFPPKVRAMLMNDYGAYQFNIAHDNQKAISLTMSAAAEDPTNAYFEINLTKLALALGQTDLAVQHLEAARNLDKAGYYGKDIGDLRAQLAQQGSR